MFSLNVYLPQTCLNRAAPTKSIYKIPWTYAFEMRLKAWVWSDWRPHQTRHNNTPNSTWVYNFHRDRIWHHMCIISTNLWNYETNEAFQKPHYYTFSSFFSFFYQKYAIKMCNFFLPSSSKRSVLVSRSMCSLELNKWQFFFSLSLSALLSSDA